MAEERAHAEKSASGSERWLKCSASVSLERDAPVSPDSPASLLGTKAHGELEIQLDRVWAGLPVKLTPTLKRDKDMREAVMAAVEFIRDIWNEDTQKLLIEERISLEYIGKDMFGTADITIVEPGVHLQVWDYKHGIGKAVDVVNKNDFDELDLNTQLVYYALGMAKRYDFNFKKVTLGILQPRAKHRSGWRRKVTVSMKELRTYEHIFRKGSERVDKGIMKYAVGSWCWFCRAREHGCPKQQSLKFEKAVAAFD